MGRECEIKLWYINGTMIQNQKHTYIETKN